MAKPLISRILKSSLLSEASHYRIVTITGPRQSGKTTLCRSLFPDRPYCSLEDPDTLDLATRDPRGFLAPLRKNGGIVDEVQRLPKLLSYIQGIVDEDKQMAQFILTGSAQFELLESITQTLAGRTSMLSLLPLSLDELYQNNLARKDVQNDDTNTILLNGFFPALYSHHIPPTSFFRNYVATFVERDVRKIKNVGDLVKFRRFLKLVAGRVGQLLDYASLSTEVGASQPTIKTWFSILEAGYILFRLEPYYENFNKRTVKSPKFYFYDTGLASFLLDIHNETQISRDPLRGYLFENLVVAEAYKQLHHQGKPPSLYFFRDNHGLEIDLLYKTGNELTPIEIKSSQTFDKSFLKGIHSFEKIAKRPLNQPQLIYDGRSEGIFKGIQLLNFRDFRLR